MSMKEMLKLAVCFMNNFLKTDNDFRWFLTRDKYVTINGIDFLLTENDYGMTVSFSEPTRYNPKWIEVEFIMYCPMRMEFYDGKGNERIIENPYEIEGILEN